MAHAPATFQVPIELFGTARIRGGTPMVTLALPWVVELAQIVQALAAECPALVGNVIRRDLSGLEDGYAFNRSGVAFLGEETVSLQPGDSLLVLSSQAGG
jgi:hypothetical protein